LLEVPAVIGKTDNIPELAGPVASAMLKLKGRRSRISDSYSNSSAGVSYNRILNLHIMQPAPKPLLHRMLKPQENGDGSMLLSEFTAH